MSIKKTYSRITEQFANRVLNEYVVHSGKYCYRAMVGKKEVAILRRKESSMRTPCGIMGWDVVYKGIVIDS